MSEVRDELAETIKGVVFLEGGAGVSRKAADAILERFEVTPKPAIADGRLGVLLNETWHSLDDDSRSEELGRGLRERLDEAGLVIVRLDEVAS